jgi:type IV secretion system protein VirB6
MSSSPAGSNVLVDIDWYVDRLYMDGMNLLWTGGVVAELRILLVVSITLYVLYKGYMILAGKTQEPMKDLLWDLGSKVFILGFLYSGDRWVEQVQRSVKGLFNWASGDEIGGFVRIDGLIDNLGAMFNNVNQFSEAIYLLGFSGSADHPALAMAGYASAVAGIAIPFIIYMTAKISILFLAALAPIVIFLRLYGFTKEVFTQWLRLILSSILTTLLLTTVVGSISRVILNFQAHYVDNLSNPYQYLAQFGMYCILMAFLSKLCVSISQNLTHVSLESAGLNAVSSIYGKTHVARGFGGVFGGMAGATGAGGAMGAAGAAGGASRSFLSNIGQTMGRGLSRGKDMVVNQANKPK